VLRYGLSWAALALAAIPAAARAQDIAHDEYLVRVKPGPKRYFHLDNGERAGCPARTVACRRTAYVVSGDELVAWGETRGFTRVTFLPFGGGRPTSGWIESAALARVRLPARGLDAWMGSWVGWNGSIDITPSRQPGRLHVAGIATWGGHDPDRVARGAINTGDFEDDLAPQGNMLTYPEGSEDKMPEPDGDCRIQMRLIGPYLSVADQGICGGVNVSFAGLYRR
jgi:hypothetical protein